MCRKAILDGYTWAWADTCHMNKENPTELGEAGINSMFAWYQEAGSCYVCLSDLEVPVAETRNAKVIEERLRPCRWFTGRHKLITQRYFVLMS